jgi:hypothetical protein
MTTQRTSSRFEAQNRDRAVDLQRDMLELLHRFPHFSARRAAFHFVTDGHI